MLQLLNGARMHEQVSLNVKRQLFCTTVKRNIGSSNRALINFWPFRKNVDALEIMYNTMCYMLSYPMFIHPLYHSSTLNVMQTLQVFTVCISFVYTMYFRFWQNRQTTGAAAIPWPYFSRLGKFLAKLPRNNHNLVRESTVPTVEQVWQSSSVRTFSDEFEATSWLVCCSTACFKHTCHKTLWVQTAPTSENSRLCLRWISHQHLHSPSSSVASSSSGYVGTVGGHVGATAEWKHVNHLVNSDGSCHRRIPLSGCVTSTIKPTQR